MKTAETNTVDLSPYGAIWQPKLVFRRRDQCRPWFGPTAGGALVDHRGVDKIAFTGNIAREIIMKNAADSLKRMTFELGGKSPNVVMADADLDRAVKGSYIGLFLNQGQCCWQGAVCLATNGCKG